MLRKMALRLVKTLITCAWVIVAAEIFLRVFHPVPVIPRYVMAGSYGIRVNRPNMKYWHRSADFKIQIRTNSKGIRADKEIPYDKPPGVKRIVILGDSFGMGYEVNLEDSFTYRLERNLQNNGIKAEVVNLSVSGYGNAEELISLEQEGVKYHPDVVLLCWNSTDTADNIRCGLYQLQNGHLLKQNSEFLPGVAIQERLDRIPGYSWVEANSSLYSFAREWISWNVAKPLLLSVQRFKDPADRPGAVQAAKGDDDRYASDLTVALVKEVDRVSAAAGAHFVLLDIPEHNNNRIFTSLFPVDLKKASLGVDVVSPIATFDAHWQQGQIYWTRSQGHFTPFGCRLVGDLLSEHLLSHHLLQSK